MYKYIQIVSIFMYISSIGIFPCLRFYYSFQLLIYATSSFPFSYIFFQKNTIIFPRNKRNIFQKFCVVNSLCNRKSLRKTRTFEPRDDHDKLSLWIAVSGSHHKILLFFLLYDYVYIHNMINL